MHAQFFLSHGAESFEDWAHSSSPFATEVISKNPIDLNGSRACPVPGASAEPLLAAYLGSATVTQHSHTLPLVSKGERKTKGGGRGVCCLPRMDIYNLSVGKSTPRRGKEDSAALKWHLFIKMRVVFEGEIYGGSCL